MRDDCVMVFLAGGGSRRMGRPKAWLEFEGRPLLAHLVERMSRVFPEVLVVGAPNQDLPPTPARIVHDDDPGAGPLAGMSAGFRAATHPLAFVSACDAPFLNPVLAEHLVSLSEGYQAVAPEWGGRVHPLHAVYCTDLYPVLTESLAEGRRRVMDLLPRICVRTVTEEKIRLFDPEGLSFLNMNSPEEYERALALWPTVASRLNLSGPRE